MTVESRAGEVWQASAALLPAATTNVIPAATALDTASSSTLLAGAPRLRFATAGRSLAPGLTLERWEATQFTPATTVDTVAYPPQSATRTG